MAVIVSLAIFLISHTAFSQDMCPSPTYEKRATEIQEIVKADQDDRKGELPKDLMLRDQKRRMRIGEIFGEGCLKSAADFSASALVYQHGTVPEHFWQTFTWSKRAVELGDVNKMQLMALGLDRYLVNIGKKQLFASQAFKPAGKCWCLQPTEKSFPDAKRMEYTKRDLAQALQWVDQLNSKDSCMPAKECETNLAPTPEGSVPGFW